MKQKKLYQLCGIDTFEGRNFVVQQFDSKFDAVRKLIKCRIGVLKQPKDLRDTFWINETTEEDIQRRAKIEADAREARYWAKWYDRATLRGEVDDLLADIRDQIKDKPLSFNCGIDIHDAIAVIENNNPDICYWKIIIYAHSYENGNLCIHTKIFLNSGKASRAIKFLKTEAEEREWLNKPESIDEATSEIEDLIKKYFEE